VESDRSRQRFGIATFPVVTGRTWAARALAERGAFDEAEALGREAVGIAGTLDHPFSSVWAFLGLAYVHSLRGDMRQTEGLLDRALAHCHEHHITTWSPIVMASTGHVYALSGRVEDGVAWLERALAAYEALKMVHLHSIALAQLAESYLSAGRVDSARARADQAVALTRERGERGYEAWALRAAGDAAAHGEARDPAAEAHYAASLALASELDMRPLAAHCHLGLGKLHRDSGRRARAREHVALATAMYREMVMPFWLVLAEALMNVLA
jgi:tetratricopeptide (TPR) repeat protein